MFHEIIFEFWREKLAAEIAEDGTFVKVCPIQHGRYIAMSGLQKAVRRGDTDVALRCAARLLTDDPRALWRRLCVIAFEDIGVADPDIVGRVTAACGDKAWRLSVGGEWCVASHLVRRMCAADKDRAADDLIVPVEWHPDLERLRGELQVAPFSFLMDIAGNADRRIEARAVAAWYAAGTERVRSATLPRVGGRPTDYFEGLIERGAEETPVELGRAGLSRTGTIMPVFFPLVWQNLQRAAWHIEPDDIPEAEMIEGVPSYAFDMFTREGKAAFRPFLHACKPLPEFLADCDVAKARWAHDLGRLIFRAEGGLLSRRMSWNLGRSLLRTASILDYDLPPERAEEGIALVRSNLHLLNEARRHVLASNSQ